MSKPPFISIVSPVYGCRDCLHELADRVEGVMAAAGYEWELVLVDDRAPDQPWPIIEEIAGKDLRVRGVRLARNHGQHLAIWAGLQAARGDWVVVVDCDLQDDPSVIPALYEQAVAQGVESVVVDRGHWSDSWFRRAMSFSFNKVMRVLTDIDLSANVGNFGVYSRKLVNILLQFQETEVFLPLMVSLAGLPSSRLTLDRSDRFAGQSSYNLASLARMAMAIIVRFSDRPLKLSIVVGGMISLLAALISLVVFVSAMLGLYEVPGWASVILSIWFLSGLILGVLGVQGFYIGRIFAETRNRPRIIVDEETTAGGADPAARKED